jgi:hypothetical protein
MDCVLRASSAAKSKFGIFFFLTSSHRDFEKEKAPPRVLDTINDQPWLVMLDVTWPEQRRTVGQSGIRESKLSDVMDLFNPPGDVEIFFGGFFGMYLTLDRIELLPWPCSG